MSSKATVDSGVQVLDRVVAVLELVSAGVGSAREIASRSGIPRSSVQRLLQNLDGHEMLIQDGDRTYRLGPKTLRLGMQYLGSLDLRTTALSYMRRLRDGSKETVGLTTRIGDHRMYIERLDSPLEIKYVADFGKPYPLYCGAPGRLLLAYQADREIDAFLDRTELVAFTSSTPSSRDEVWTSINDIRKENFSEAVEEVVPGLATIATPVRDHTSGVIAALSVSGPLARFSSPQRSALVPLLIRQGQLLSRELGFEDETNVHASIISEAG